MDDLSEEWFECYGRDDAARFEQELRREMPGGHDMSDDEFVCVAWRRHMKETVFWLPGRQEWAVVHLTWTEESDPRWPSTEFCATWREVVSEVRDRGRP